MNNRPSVNDHACPACGAPVGTPCNVPLAGVDTTDWSHDARILAPVVEHIRHERIPPASTQTEEGR